MKKKIISTLLAIIMVCSMVPTAFAASAEATKAADSLYELGLFKGTGTNPDGSPIYDLDKAPSRNQAIIMLVRLLGKEEEALAGTWEIPFVDVADSVRPYIGYAYANGLTNGTSATTYSGTNPIRANQYIAFVLRALGYESGKDFEVGTSYTLSNALGITNGEYTNATTFTRGDVAIISHSALSAKLKASDKTLLETLGKSLPTTSENNTETVPEVVVPVVPKEIIVPDAHILGATASGQNQISLNWTIYSGKVDGYEIYQSTSEDGYYEKVTSTTGNVCSTTITGLNPATTYYYKVRPYIVDNGTYHYGAYSYEKGVTTASAQRFSIELPSLPTTISWYKSSGERYSSASITNIRYSKSNNVDGSIRVDLYFSGTKTYNGSGNVYAVRGEWALIEKDTGYVADTGRISKHVANVGDTFSNASDTAGLVGEGLREVTYVLEIYDH